LLHKKYEIGAGAFTTLYQGRPAAEGGIIFKREWLRSYTQAPQIKRTVVSLDSAFKTGQANDFSAIQVWGEAQTGLYLLARWKGKCEFPELKRVLISICDQWKPEEVLIEDAASGQSLLQELDATTTLPLKPVRPDRDKEARAQSCTGMLEAGRVYLPADAEWLSEFVDELTGFPHMRHDDEVDACTQALIFLRGESYENQFALLDMNNDGRLAKMFVDRIAAGAQAVRDIWGHVIGNPRADNLDKKAMYPLEAANAGVSVQQVVKNMSGQGVWKDPPAPACENPDLKDAKGNKVRCDGKTAVVGNNRYRCTACGHHQWGPSGPPMVVYVGRNGFVEKPAP
jgi:predicted phage terminase large subunit-like protein